MSLNILHNFAGAPNDGEQPGGSLSLSISGSTLYGMTPNSGTNNQGIIFSKSTNGDSYIILHNFAGGLNDGGFPNGSLCLSTSGSTLYGVTTSSGANDKGIIFSISTNGSSFTILHNFAGEPNDGAYPTDSLILSTSGSTLYGMTPNGGVNDKGIIFSISTIDSTYTILHNFAGEFDGANPTGSLCLSISGLTLYGMTPNGGVNDKGIIFSISTNGSSFTILHNFTGGLNDGALPFGSLILSTSGLTLYGMTQLGGVNDKGIVFSINTDGTSFTILHNFAGGLNDGAFPSDSLSLSISGFTLYGMTNTGGVNDKGIIFSISTNGSSFTILHNFAGEPNDGSNPNGSLSLSISGSTLYGMTPNGGVNDIGIIFSLLIQISPISNICFPAGTPILTDQGLINIENLNKMKHTITGQSIKCITQTVTLDKYLISLSPNSIGRNVPSRKTIMTKDHKIEFEGRLVPAERFLDYSSDIKKVKYNGEILFNVLLENYGIMNVNGLKCETLHPNNIIAKLYTNNYTEDERNIIIFKMNDSLEKRDLINYTSIVNYLQ